MAILFNGLPIVTFELKNKLTKQSVEDAIQSNTSAIGTKKELLFQFDCSALHFTVDDHEVRMCMYLEGKSSIHWRRRLLLFSAGVKMPCFFESNLK